MPKCTSMKAIMSKCYFLFYEKTSPENMTNKLLEIQYWSYPNRDSNSNPLHKPIENEIGVFPVTSKTFKQTKELVVLKGKKIGSKEIPYHLNVRNDELNKYQEIDHTTKIRLNLHEEFKYIYGCKW